MRNRPFQRSARHARARRSGVEVAQALGRLGGGFRRVGLGWLGALVALVFLDRQSLAEDWPTYMHDYQRSGIAAEDLATNLAPAWVFPRVKPPVPAWADEPKYDYFVGSAGQPPLKPRVVFDRANHVAVAGGRVYVGSSAEHTVHCLDALTGEPRWTFFADAPVRAAPTVANGRVYVGADDGWVYCLDGAGGALIWKHAAAGTNNYLVPNNGRFVSPFAVRSGVAVENGTAYFAAGTFPSEGVYLCAVEAATGQIKTASHWQKRFVNTASFQGYLLLSPTRVYVPGARSNPFYFDRPTGSLLGQYNDRNALGTFALLAGSSLFFGPAARAGAQITEGGTAGDNLATYPNGNAIVVAAIRSYLLSDTALTALDRTTRRPVWTRSANLPNALILAGKTLVAGGPGQVGAFNADTGNPAWSLPVEGEALGLAAAGGRLFVSTDQGLLYALAPKPAERSDTFQVR